MEERVAGNEFAGLLGELKQRSGLSYGVLAKRLHVSTSTLHRYVNGDAVPTDYAPVERLARACRATPEELVELHRRWVLADALRRQANGAGTTRAEESRAEESRAEADGAGEGGTSGGSSGAADGPDGSAADAPGSAPETEPGNGQEAGPGDVVGGETGIGRKPGRAAASVPARWSRRAVVLAGAGAVVAAAVVSTALTARFGSGGGEDDTKGKAVALGAPPAPSASRSSATPGTRHGSASASPSHGARPRPTGSTTAGAVGEHGAADGGADDGAAHDGAAGKSGEGAGAPNVVANAYKWDSPCSQHYLLNRDASHVPPPPTTESDARGWVTALGGVASGEQMIALTVQGTGRATVVLEALHVRVVQKGAPLAWNDYAMGVGCGGNVETKSFTVDLDAGSPATGLKGGQRDFPYKVSESDPEVFYVFADARAHDVSWYLEIDWSSGTRSGTVRVDDHGKPFRTSGNAGRPAYDHPLGSSEWSPASTG
ncbi:helix-turn-helix domain-containing protein [Streptomyces triticiradicis]|uniref:Helix-turn-helix domain-containing protein n=1 Tax=Streptomyces triticiradicis TaxID=2651189 RepID=A0A7J5DEQ6_9ACTN|nr:helix-turn-helix transcriptional regulator [Streptomyces triticiradicis]KAB1987040.1 helix-turn-helix domain-containing protein [Streptomyces triticiradicis]